METTRIIIEQAYDRIAEINSDKADTALKQAVAETIASLDAGKLRVAYKENHSWKVQDWLKKAILLYFRLQSNRLMVEGEHRHYDKIPLKFSHWSEQDFQSAQLRIVPPATVRYGAYIASNTVIMPSYINIGAYVGENTMVDTWATVGSCAQIGKNVHISGGVGIGGVLEPLQSQPTIIEDHCFIGARSEIVEGAIVEEGAVIAMGVYISQSTRIFDRESGEIFYGRVPAGAVVVPGSLPVSDGRYQLSCAIIVKRVDEKTKRKVGINALLREAVCYS